MIWPAGWAETTVAASHTHNGSIRSFTIINLSHALNAPSLAAASSSVSLVTIRQPIPFRRLRARNLRQKLIHAFPGCTSGAFFQVRLCDQTRETLGQGDGHERVHG